MTTDNCRSRYRPLSTTFELPEVQVVRDGSGGTLISVRGPLDRMAVPLLAGCLREVLDVGGSGRTVLLDLSGTDFVDLGGMRLLAEATGWAKARGVQLRLAGCSATLVRVLHLSRLIDGVDLVPSGQT